MTHDPDREPDYEQLLEDRWERTYGPEPHRARMAEDRYERWLERDERRAS